MSRLLHPLIRNPVKWLKGVTKRHSQKFYQEDFYDSSSLSSNPFAQILQSTRKDVSGYRFPLGNMIQVVVEKNRSNKKYELVPVLEKPEKGQNPASYLINDKAYLQLLSQKQIRPVPLKYRQRSTAILGQLSMSDQFVEKVDEMYQEEIEKYFQHENQIDHSILPHENQIDKTPSITLRPETDAIIGWDKNTPVVLSDAVTKDTSVPYNLKITLLSIKRAMYNNPIYTKGPASPR